VLKVAALALLWAVFFSPAHRHVVDGAAARARLGVVAAPPAVTPAPAPPRAGAAPAAGEP
jgi:hypothetical protein